MLLSNMSTTTAAGGDCTSIEQTKNQSEGDEELVGMSLTTCRDDDDSSGDAASVEMMDPAIVARGNIVKPPKFTYTRERLIEISELPLSKVKPKFLESPLNDGLAGIWTLERNHSERKRPETPNDENVRNEVPPENHLKRRSGDPRERIRKEQDGIVLSPQRRSFNLGCSAPLVTTAPRPGRPESPLGKSDLIHRPEIGTRRIGSGRIITRDVSWDYKGENESQEYNFRPGGGAQITRGERQRDTRDNERDERFERRSFGRDFERDREQRDREREREQRDREREKDSRHNTRNGSRYGSERRRQISEGKEDEPEWFSGGPTSQNDTIELRGFDDIPEERNTSSRRQKTQITQKKKRETNNNQTISIKEQSPPQRNNKTLNESKMSAKEDSPPKGPGGRSTPKQEQVQMIEPEHSPVHENSCIGREEKDVEQRIYNKKEENSIDANKQDNDSLSDNSKIIDDQPDILEDFLKMDSSFVGFLPNVGESEETVSGSRFQRWFTRESPIKQHDSRRSSLQDEIINNMIKDITEPNIMIPHMNDSDTYFAPISPAAASMNTQTTNAGPIGPPPTQNNHHNHNNNHNNNNNVNEKTTSHLLELLRVGKTKQPVGNDMPIKNLNEVPGKVLSLEEIEANIRHAADKAASGVSSQQNNMSSSVMHNKSDEDMTAFKRLLAQVSGGHAIPATNGPLPQKSQPMSLLQMLNKSQQDENILRNNSQQSHMPMNHPPQIPPELVVKLHQVQQQQQRQEMFNKLMQANVGMGNRQYQASPLSSEIMNTSVPSANLELLQRPEAQAIIQGLKRGDITPQHLRQQLANHAIQPRHREMIHSVLKLHAGAGLPPPPQSSIHPSPRAVSPGGQHPDLLQQIMFQQQQQQLRVSPLPPNAIPQRIPSPRELQQHTQNIMQQALIKKKLEEQRENFRKKQEQQRSMSPANNTGHGTSPAKHLSPTPHSFTPTSVLRKMTASKDIDSIGNASIKDKVNSIANNLTDPTTKQQMAAVLSQVNSQQQNQMQQGRAVTGMRQPPPNTQQSQMNLGGWNTQNVPVKQGRPILKGNNYQQYNTGGVDYHSRNLSHLQQQSMNTGGNFNAMFAQMQQNQQQAQQQQQQQQRSAMNNPNSVGNNGMGGNNGSYLSSGGFRSLSNNNNMNNSQHNRPHPLQLNFSQLQRGVHPTIQQLLQMQQQGQQGYGENRGIPITGRSNNSMQFNNRGSPLADNMPGDLSPTSDQLARWFSPELLAQARAGKLPDMPPVSVAQNARSLEELERIQQAAAAVHN
ncbi:eukaryotic translation initiation factor 4E transporter isoform X2 [Chrysoperla carnea]|uniref:eukaryotic translation initiation factor 4E transporter isoform X2 n=1 Tax=Chrysoperla carnea TaxID=189513 RepID=UPI001D08C0DD|nr:eukaryotic translation initiation factor 4E transporter isoform X2 [Chrysoperla carnea]